jgi:hypothetical protein
MGLTAREPFKGNANTEKTFKGEMISLYLANDGTSDVDFTINGFTFTIKAGEEFDEILDPFKKISITTTSNYRAWVRGR